MPEHPGAGPEGPEPAEPALSAEDAKLVTLARAARSRAYVPHGSPAAGAAVRDTDGRTYAAATVENADPTWTVSALQAAMAAAASSGVRSLEAAALVRDGDALEPGDEAVLREFAVPQLHLVRPDGSVTRTWSP